MSNDNLPPGSDAGQEQPPFFSCDVCLTEYTGIEFEEGMGCPREVNVYYKCVGHLREFSNDSYAALTEPITE